MHANFMRVCRFRLWEGNLVSPIYLECRDTFSVDLTAGFLKIRVICVIRDSEYFDKNIIAWYYL